MIWKTRYILYGYKEEMLHFYDEGIIDITCLRCLENIKFLDLSHNRIVDISPLYHLKNLENLNLMHNPIKKEEDIEKLQKSLPNCKISY